MHPGGCHNGPMGTISDRVAEAHRDIIDMLNDESVPCAARELLVDLQTLIADLEQSRVHHMRAARIAAGKMGKSD